MSPLLAQSRHPCLRRTCPLSGVKRTCRFALHISAFDPKRTFWSEALTCHLSHTFKLSRPPRGAILTDAPYREDNMIARIEATPFAAATALTVFVADSASGQRARNNQQSYRRVEV